MRNLVVFNQVTLDGYLAGEHGDISWAHRDIESATLVKHDVAGAIRQLKQASGAHMAITGSGSLVSQLAHEGLIDEYQLVVIPVVLGKGRTMFEGISPRLTLKPTRTRTFDNGNVLLCYEPTR
jgi:dihydrofolate reductase